MGVFYEKAAARQPSRGLCLGCRHVGNERYSTTGHCHGTGDLEATDIWPGFVCTCPCREKEWKPATSATR